MNIFELLSRQESIQQGLCETFIQGQNLWLTFLDILDEMIEVGRFDSHALGELWMEVTARHHDLVPVMVEAYH
jgi:hypothetical protein